LIPVSLRDGLSRLRAQVDAGWTTDSLALGTGVTHTRLYPLHDQGPLKFSHGTDDLEHQAPRGCAQVQLLQNGDAEGCLLFRATDAAQARLAIRAIGAKARRKPSEAQLAVLRRARMAKRPHPRSIWPEPPAPGAKQRQISIRTGQAGVLASSVAGVRVG
jgi:hypothetical protein